MTSDVVERVKDRVTIFDLCEYTEDGLYSATYRSDSDPSMEIFDNGRAFKDYGDNEYKGDVFDFYAAQNGLDPEHDFHRILEDLAGQAGIELDHGEDYEEERKERKRIQAVMSRLCSYYEECLEEHTINGETVAERVKDKRGWKQDTLEEHRIGYAPPEDEQSEFIDELIDEYGSDTLLKTGLFLPGPTEPFFTDRVVFPYLKAGKPRYFTARKTETNDDGLGKYIKQLQSKDYVADFIDEPLWTYTRNQTSTVIITEGMPDAITTAQHGYDVITPVTVQYKEEHRGSVAEATQRYDEAVIINDAEENDAGEKGAQKMLEGLDKIRPEHRADLIKKGELPLPEGQEKNDIEAHLRDQDEPREELTRIVKDANTLFEERFEELPDDQDTVSLADYAQEILECMQSVKRNAKGENKMLRTEYIKRIKKQIYADKSDVKQHYGEADENWDDPVQERKERLAEKRRERKEKRREEQKENLADEGRLVEYEDHLGVQIQVQVEGSTRSIEYVYECPECMIQRRTDDKGFPDVEMPAMHNERIPQPGGECPNCESKQDLNHIRAEFTVPEQAYQDVRSEDFLTRIVEEIDDEHVKDHKAKVATLLTCATGWLDEQEKRQSVTFKGESGVGKDHVMDTVADKLPDEYVLDLTDPSSAWLRRNANRPRLIHVSEVNLQSGGANSGKEKLEFIKQARQGGSKTARMVESHDGNGWESETFHVEQKPFLFGSTEIGQDHELSTREFIVPITYKPDKGKSQSKLRAEHHNDLHDRTTDDDGHHWIKDAWRLLDPEVYVWNPAHVVVEKYFEENEDVWQAFQKKHEMPRVMRDKERIKAFSEAVTWIQQYNRETTTVNGQKYVIGEPKDFLTAFYVFQDFYTDTYHGLDQRYKEFLNTMEEIEDDYQKEWDNISDHVESDLVTFEEHWIRRKKIAEEMNLSKKRARQIEKELRDNHQLVESEYKNSWSMIGTLVKRTEGGRKNPRKHLAQPSESEHRFQGFSEGVSTLFQGLKPRLEDELYTWRDRWTSSEAYTVNLKKRFFDPLRNEDEFPGEGGPSETERQTKGEDENHFCSDEDDEPGEADTVGIDEEPDISTSQTSPRQRVKEAIEELSDERDALDQTDKANVCDEADIDEDYFEKLVAEDIIRDEGGTHRFNDHPNTAHS